MMTYKINTGNFLKQLLKRMRPALLLVAIVALVYVYLMQFVDHALSWVPYIVIFSYAADFTCLVAANPSSFKGFKPFESFNYFEYLFETFYFSVVTFATIGYGDIVPVTSPAKILVLMEIGQSFVVVVFGFSNLKNIQNSNKSQ